MTTIQIIINKYIAGYQLSLLVIHTQAPLWTALKFIVNIKHMRLLLLIKKKEYISLDGSDCAMIILRAS